MSTQFFYESGAWACTRYGTGDGKVALDFGVNTENVIKVIHSCLAGRAFTDETGRVYPGLEFHQLVLSIPWTFGIFGGTMAVGSGDICTFEGIS